MPPAFDTVAVRVTHSPTQRIETGTGKMRPPNIMDLVDGFLEALKDFTGIDLSGLATAVQTVLNTLGDLIIGVGGAVIGDVVNVINGLVGGLSGLIHNLLHNAASVIGSIPQNLVSGLSGALASARAFVQQVIDAILSALRGLPVIGGLIPDLKKSVQQNKVDQQNFTISAIVSDYRNPSYVCRYPIADVTYAEFYNNQLSSFGTTDGASAGTAHTHTVGQLNSLKTGPSGWSVAQNESRGSYITVANTTVHDTIGLVLWKDAGTLNNVFVEIFKESADKALTRVFSVECSGLITTSTQYLEFPLTSRLIVQSGERFLARVRNSSTVATVVRLIGVERVNSAPDDGFKTVGAALTAQTAYTPAQAATARGLGITLNWFMLAAKNMPTVDRSFSDDANRLGIGGMWVRQSSTAALLDVYEEAFGYTGTLDGDQSALYIHSCTRDVNRVEANLYINGLSTARSGVLMHCSRDFSQVVYLGVDGTSAKIYSGSALALTERASLSIGGTDKWSMYYDEAADKYVALKAGAVVDLQWTSVGAAVKHGLDYRFGGLRISSAAGQPAGTIDDWNLRDWYIAVPQSITTDRMEAAASLPDAMIRADVAAAPNRMVAHAVATDVALTAGLDIDVPRMSASAAMANADVTDGAFTPVLMTYDTPGTYEYTIPAGCTRIDRIALAGGRGGRHYAFGASTNGGEAGAFAWDTLIAGVDFAAGDTITVVVGAGGTPNGGLGGNSTIATGANVLTAIGGDTYVSGSNGQAVTTGNLNSNKDVLLNDQFYFGGATTTSATRDNPEPGAGGWGSNSNGIAGRLGGKGKAWLYAHT